MDSQEQAKTLFNGRALQTITNGKIDFNINDFMKFELVPGEESADPSLLRFNPILSDFTGTTFSVRFDWDFPLQVSTGKTPDKVKSEFIDPRLFFDPTSGMFAFNPQPMYSDIPQQFIRSAAADGLKASCEMFSISTVIFVAVAIITSLVLTGLSKSVWSFVNLVQLMAYLKFFGAWPANA